MKEGIRFCQMELTEEGITRRRDSVLIAHTYDYGDVSLQKSNITFGEIYYYRDREDRSVYYVLEGAVIDKAFPPEPKVRPGGKIYTFYNTPRDFVTEEQQEGYGKEG